MWDQLKRIIKPNGAIVLFGAQPFTSVLVTSNLKMFKYCWVWVKNRPTGAQHSKNRPMAKHEDVCVFSSAPMGHASQLGSKRMHYNPQGVTDTGKTKTVKERGSHGRHIGARPNQVGNTYPVFTGYPATVLEFSKEEAHDHPTQKPVALMEYLIKTYTNEGDTVLDFTAGSMSTAVACINTNRKCIMIERDEHYYNIGKDRVIKALQDKDIAKSSVQPPKEKE